MLPESRMAIAVTVTGKNIDEIKQQIIQANKYSIDLLEWRIDVSLSLGYCAKSQDFIEIAKFSTFPIILTYRTKVEGGAMIFNQQLYESIYQWAVNAGFEYLDIEFTHWQKFERAIDDWQKVSTIIVSQHNFSQIPQKLENTLKIMGETRADIIKFAGMSHSLSDTEMFLKIINSYKSKPIIGIAMGPFGKISRFDGARFGSKVSYAPLPGATNLAPGQIDLPTLIQLINDKK